MGYWVGGGKVGHAPELYACASCCNTAGPFQICFLLAWEGTMCNQCTGMLTCRLLCVLPLVCLIDNKAQLQNCFDGYEAQGSLYLCS